MRHSVKKITVTLSIIFIINFAGQFLYKRFDLTADKRFTLSQTTSNILSEIKEPLYVDVFLEGKFPGEFKKLQTETQQLLEELKAQNESIIFQFVNPLEDEELRDNTIQSFMERGMTPVRVTINEKGQQTQEVVFPWAIVTCGNRAIKVPLLKNMMGASTAEKVISSVQHLEYAFANAINTVSKDKKKKVVIISGNGELNDLYIADFIKSVRDNYYIAPFTLDSVAKSPVSTLKQLKKYDLAIIAKPTEAFSDEEKQVLDQYIINGGKTVWLIDYVNMEIDSLYNESGSNVAFPRDLNLNDMFFKYGIRIRPDLIKDLVATPITLETGPPGSGSQKVQLPWYLSPMVYPLHEEKHPIVSNLDGIKFQFASPIEPLKNSIKKTILLQSSKYSKLIGTPSEVDLRMASEELVPKDFVGFGNYPVAVLLEGKFHSVYENRVLPFKDTFFKSSHKDGKMIVISDGDVIKNQLDKNGREVELGLDQRSGILYANKDLIMNCVNYLLDDNGLINIRSKEVNLPILDTEKVVEAYVQSQIITVVAPIFILIVFGIFFNVLRKRNYSR